MSIHTIFSCVLGPLLFTHCLSLITCAAINVRGGPPGQRCANLASNFLICVGGESIIIKRTMLHVVCSDFTNRMERNALYFKKIKCCSISHPMCELPKKKRMCFKQGTLCSADIQLFLPFFVFFTIYLSVQLLRQGRCCFSFVSTPLFFFLFTTCTVQIIYTSLCKTDRFCCLYQS